MGKLNHSAGEQKLPFVHFVFLIIIFNRTEILRPKFLPAYLRHKLCFETQPSIWDYTCCVLCSWAGHEITHSNATPQPIFLDRPSS